MEEPSHEIDDISVCLTGEAVVVVIIQLHAGMPVMVKRTECLAVPAES